MSHPAPLRIKLVPPDIKRTAKIYGVTKEQQKLISELVAMDIARRAAGGGRVERRDAARRARRRGRSVRRRRMAI